MKVLVLGGLVCLCVCTVRAAPEWCYGQAWCLGMTRRVDRDHRASWPPDVVKVDYLLGDENFAGE